VSYGDVVHLLEWTFDRKLFKFQLILTSILVLNLTLTLTLSLKHKNLFGKQNDVIFRESSGVAWVPCALGQKYFYNPINKTAESEVKIDAKADVEHLLMLHLFFRS